MVAMVALTAICIRSPNVVFFKRIASHSTHIMLLFVMVGLFFLVINQRRLLFTAFSCAAALCLYFKYTANISLEVPVKTSDPSFKIAHLSTSELISDYEAALDAVKAQKPDLISVLELTPDWQEVLGRLLLTDYPFRAEVTRIDFYGLAVYSKYAISGTDTLYHEEIPTLRVEVLVDPNHTVQIFSSNTNPPLFRRSFEQLRDQLGHIASYIDHSELPTITAGNYNLDQFSDELQDFRAKADLNDSRKTMSPSLNPPTNHLFYNKHLTCLQFQNLYDTLSNRIGIIGEYQLRPVDDQIVKRDP